MANIEKVVNEYINSNPFSGQIIIAKQNEIIARFESGYKELEAKISFDRPQVFPIASVTKQFVATAVLRLMEQNKLDVNKYIKDYLPEKHLLWQADMPDWANCITLHHLLCHSSGLPNYYFMALANPSDWQYINRIEPQYIYPAIVSKIKDLPLDFAPGSKFAYNDINYLLLGLILEEFTPNKDLGLFFKRELFKPLGLNNTTWPSVVEEMTYINHIYLNPNFPKRYVVNYQEASQEPILVTTHGTCVPSGGGGHMISTGEDLLKWNHALHSGKILSMSFLELMHKVHMQTESSYYLGKLSYGYGIIIEPLENKVIYWHPGSYPTGLNVSLSYDPLNQIGIAITSNLSISDANSSEKIAHPGRVLFNVAKKIHYVL